MPPITRHNTENESDEPVSTPARLTGHKRSRPGSRAPPSESQVPQYIPKVKSCVACRQQKIKCDVVREPFEPCSHCRRLNKECTIDLKFKRIAKRDQLEHLNQQIRDLRQQLELAKRSPPTLPDTPQDNRLPTITSVPRDQTIDDVSLSGREIANLFDVFFKHYHEYCPILNPEVGSDFCFEMSPILGWTIVLISARRYPQNEHLLGALMQPCRKLLWSTMSEMPQKYHIVKALALLCTWPIPLTAEIGNKHSTEKPGPGLSRLGLSELDPTFMLSGIMMQIAMQTGLYISSQMQYVTKQYRNSGKAEIEDRQLTWVVCNIVAQDVAITYGRPSRSIYNSDWTSVSTLIGTEIDYRLKIMRFCDKLTSSLYTNSAKHSEELTENDISPLWSQLHNDLDELESFVGELSPFNKLSLLAAKVHFNAVAFFITSTSPVHFTAISAAYNSAIAFIQGVLDPDMNSASLLPHCTNYFLRTLISASCVLLKVLNSSIAVNLDPTHGKAMFNACILAVRSISVKKNDFPDRVAEAHTRMWRAAGGGYTAQQNTLSLADPLTLVIRNRMCVSHVYDYVWSWRRQMSAPQTLDQQTLTPSDTTIALNSSVTEQDTSDFSDQPFMVSQLEDFDFFNTLDWSFDDTLSSSWS